MYVMVMMNVNECLSVRKYGAYFFLKFSFSLFYSSFQILKGEFNFKFNFNFNLFHFQISNSISFSFSISIQFQSISFSNIKFNFNFNFIFIFNSNLIVITKLSFIIYSIKKKMNDKFFIYVN